MDILESAKRIKKEMWMKRSSFLGLEEYTNGNASYEHGKSSINDLDINNLTYNATSLLMLYIMFYRFGKFEVQTSRFVAVSRRGASTRKTFIQPEQTRTATT